MAFVNWKGSKGRFFYLKFFGCIFLIAIATALFYKNRTYCLADDASENEIITHVLEKDLFTYKKALFEATGRSSDEYTHFVEDNIREMPICCWVGREKGHVGDGFFFNTSGNFYYSFFMIAPKPSINEKEANNANNKYVNFFKYFDKCGRLVESSMQDMTKTEYNKKIEIQKKRLMSERKEQHAIK